MFLHAHHPLGRAAGFLAILCSTPLLLAADPKIFTQKPEIVAVEVRGELAKPKAKEIRSQDDLFKHGPKPLWIWGADDNRRYLLRKEFDGGATAGRLKAACDNRMRLLLNGQEIARADDWERPVEADVSKLLKPGKNVLEADVTNAGGPAGFVLKLALTAQGAQTRYLISDDSWQAREPRKSIKSVSARKIAMLGDDPWKDVFAAPASFSAFSNTFQVLPGFQVERLFTVPRSELGSWVCLACDNKGRLIASDEGRKGPCRITPPPLGSSQEVKVERLDANVSGAQGLLWAFDSLYVMVNGGPGSGLYRLRDTHGDDRFDKVTKLRPIAGGGEHGPHAVRLAPDGKSLYFVCGNHTDLPAKIDASRVPSNWGEDLLLPRQWDANGHARGRMAPGGWIANTDPDSKKIEIVSVGYRNAYRFSFNADGEMFAYDADMEWDFGTPWYRPTRLAHATSGSEFGWRSGTGKWPAYYVDSLPPVLDIGPGSPVGMTFGYGARFPAKYQKALYLLDWTFGTIYALHLTPDGSSYKAVKEEFLSRTPLPLTDAAIGADGALYFTIGGRGTQSELFRVTYTGKEPTDSVDLHDARNAEQRALRHQLEAYHQPTADQAKAVEFIYPHLGHGDRFIRYAARVALEHQKPNLWQDHLLQEKDAETLITGAVAFARQGDKKLQTPLLAALDRLNYNKLTEMQQLELLRVYQLVFIRMGEPGAATAARLAKKFDTHYPDKRSHTGSGSEAINRELAALLVYLKSPTVIAKSIELMRQESRQTNVERIDELLARNRGYGDVIARMLANRADQQKLHYLFVLRNLRDGWTWEQRKFYFQQLNDARKHSGGASYQGFLNNIEKEAFDNASDSERLAIEAAGLRKPFQMKELPKPKGPGRDWKLDALVKFAEPRLTGRNFKNGQRMYAAARCIVCHRFNGEGGATGPDLSQVAGRFNLKDLCESMVEPSKVVSDQYRASVVTMESGKFYSGRIVNETKDKLTILLDPEDSTKIAEVKKSAVEAVKPSAASLMPEGLLKALNDNEVLDLLAYLLSRGDPKSPMFRR
ncbi:MAG TPA: c-type cytochrome [Gemmataceae bacterium]|nr:c-type cytochrome [Gemmataceae bacterium]